MLKFSHKGLIFFSGVVWLLIGTLLLYKGVNFLAIVAGISPHAQKVVENAPLMQFFNSFLSSKEESAVLIIGAALLVGFLKGRVVLKKTVGRTISRICALPSPAPFYHVYHRGYYLLIALMAGFGFLLSYAPLDVRGAVDAAVGSALIHGASLYFKMALQINNDAKAGLK